MKFSLLKLDNPKKLKSLSKNKINFFKKEEDVSFFHLNKFNNDLYHAVFNIRDEYQVGTKKLGEQLNYSYSSLVNFFFLLENRYAMIELINSNYRDEVIGSIKDKTKCNIELATLTNDNIFNIYNSLEGSIKKLEYVNEEEEFIELDYVSNERFKRIVDNSYNVIDRIMVLVKDQYISISNKGSISVDNSNENYLIEFTKRIINSVDN